MKTIRWGIIGCGNVTEIKSGPGFQQASNSKLVAVMRRDRAKAKDYAQRHNVPKWYDDGEKLINDPDVDAVYVATPPNSHELYTLLAAKAGKPVYVEKPMARTFQECQRMVDACNQAKVPLFVAYYRRSLPRYLKIKQLIESGAIGTPRYVSVLLHTCIDKDELDPKTLPWRVIPEIAGAGRFLDLASHTLDLMDFFLGPVARVSGTAANQAKLYPAEDIVTTHFTFESGVQGIGVWCFTSFKQYDVNEITGSKGRLRFSTFAHEPIELHTADGVEQIPLENPLHIQQPHIQSIVNELNGQGVCPSHGGNAARTSWVMDEILKDWRTSQSDK